MSVVYLVAQFYRDSRVLDAQGLDWLLSRDLRCSQRTGCSQYRNFDMVSKGLE